MAPLDFIICVLLTAAIGAVIVTGAALIINIVSDYRRYLRRKRRKDRTRRICARLDRDMERAVYDMYQEAVKRSYYKGRNDVCCRQTPSITRTALRA